MEKSIVSRQLTERELEALALRKAGTIHEAALLLGNAGSFSIFQRVISDPSYRHALLGFHRNYVPVGLNCTVLLKWFQENDLEKYLTGGSLEEQVKAWEIFYREFYGDNFQLDRKKILVDARRLPAIKAGLEIGAINSVQVEATSEVLTGVNQTWTEAEYFFIQVLVKTGINIWAKTGRDRWTGKTLNEVLTGYIPVLPEDFNPVALREDWAKECWRVAEKKGPASKVIPGIVRLNFVDGRRDIPSGQQYISQTGEVVKVRNCSFIEAVEKNIKLVTPVQEILLVAKMFSDTGEYLARDTWEFNLALLRHEEKNPIVSVAYAGSAGSEFNLDSNNAARSDSYFRLRLSL